MKKIIAAILCFNFLCTPVFCAITDDFAEKSLDKNMQIKKAKKVVIKDDFVQNSLNENLKIKEKTQRTITDSFAEKNKNKNQKIKTEIEYSEQLPAVSDKKITKKVVFIDDSEMKPITVNIKKYFTTRQNVDEGDYVEFETINPVKIANKNYPVGTTVTARIETLSRNKSMGVPSDLVLGNFSIDGIPLAGEVSKTGANRTFWVYPCVYGLWWFFGVGLLFIPIRGGHAKITPSQTYTLYTK